MSFLNSCNVCECKEFVSSPYQTSKCINCFHYHAPPEFSNNNDATNGQRKPTVSGGQQYFQKTGQPTSMYARMTMKQKQLQEEQPPSNKEPSTSPSRPLPPVNNSNYNYWNNFKDGANTNTTTTTATSTSGGTTANPVPPPTTTTPVLSPSHSATSPPTVKRMQPISRGPITHTSSAPSLRPAVPSRPIPPPPGQQTTTTATSHHSTPNLPTDSTTAPPIKKLTDSEYRERITREILESERVYVNNITTLIQDYLLPLRKDSRGTKNFEEIFSNIEEILQINEVLIKNLEGRLAHWSNTDTKIGDVFLDVGPYLKPYYTKYTEQYQYAQNALKECEKNPLFLTWEEKTQADLKGQTIRSFLIMPIQRIPRYNLLIEDLIKRTDPKHVDYANLTSSLEKMKGIANDINQAIKAGENRQKILNIQNSFVSGKLNLVEPHRIFIKDGPLMKMCRKGPKGRWFFLFNDLLIHANTMQNSSLISLNKYVLHQTFRLTDIRMQDIPDGDTQKNAFQIVTASKSFTVIAATQEEKVDWMLYISQAINESHAKRATFVGGKAESGGARLEAPVWQPDSETNNCSLCNVSFGMLKRKHHCRACGKIVCGDCSNKRVTLQNLGSSLVRVCDLCYFELTHQLENP